MTSPPDGANGGRWPQRLLRGALVVVTAAVGMLAWASLAGGVQPYETYESVVTRDEPAAQFRFGDASGSSTIADSAGSYAAANGGIGLGGEGPFPGSHAGSFGGSEYATLPSDPLKEATAFTVEGWVDWGGGSSYGQPIFDFGSAAGNHMYLTPAASASKHPPLFEILTPSGSASVKTTKALATGAWEYVAVTEASSEGSNKLTLYLNGAVAAETPGATLTPASLGSSVPDDYLGKSLSGAPSLSGGLSNLAFYRKALTAKQVEEHYNDAEYPVNTSPPVISGTPKEGSGLTAGEGTWTGAPTIKYTFQWERCTSPSACTAISKATKATYTPVSEDVDNTLRVAVQATNGAGSGGASSEQTGTVEGKPANTALPMISGEAKVGQLLSVSEGNWRAFPAPATFGYLWENCVKKECKAAEGEDEQARYRITGPELGDTLRAAVTATDASGAGSATSAATAKVVPGPPVNVELPIVSGLAKEGQELAGGLGVWAGTVPIEYAYYRWFRCAAGECQSVEGESGTKDDKYKLTASDVGYTIEAQITAKNSVGETTATSVPTAQVTSAKPEATAPPTISGEAKDERTLTATTGTWTGNPTISYTYQWESCNTAGEACSSIQGATGSSYAIAHEEVGRTIRVKVLAKNEAGAASATSMQTATIVPSPPANTAPPTVSGEAKDEQTLTASAGAWVGTSTITYTYQWESCNTAGEGCAAIEGATGSSYAIAHGEVGHTIRVHLTAKNEAGTSSATSTQTTTVVPSLPVNTAAPKVSGEAKDEQTLTASTGSWTGSPTITYAYQWQICNAAGEGCAAIEGATGASYTIAHEEVGHTIRVKVTAKNEAGASSATSTPTTAVVPSLPVNTASPTISGEAKDEQTLTASTGVWSGSPTITYAYQWESCNSLGEGCLPISGATASSYTLTAHDIGTTLRILVTATNSAGATSSSSQASATVASGGAPELVYLGALGSPGSADGELERPWDVAIDNEGDVWVLDRGNDRVEEFNHAGEYVQQFGSQGAGDGQLDEPQALAVSPEGDIWVLDHGNERLEEFDANGGFVRTAGEGVIGESEAIAVAPDGDVWVAHTYSPAHLIVFNSDGEELQNIGSEGAEPGQLTFPQGLAIDASGNIWVSEGGIDRVQEFNGEGKLLRGFGTAGSAPGQMREPYGIAVGAGHVFIADSENERIDEFSETGEYITVLPAGPGGGSPHGVALAGSEDVFATDAQADRIDEWGPPRPGQPTNTAPPTITGETQELATLQASAGSWNGSRPVSYSFQWQRCNEAGAACTPIQGATSAHYAATSSDVGSTLRVTVMASNVDGEASAASSPTGVIQHTTAPKNVSPPSTYGNAEIGGTVYASIGSWEGRPSPSYTFQWQQCNTAGEQCANIEGATREGYTLSERNGDATLRVVVTASNVGGEAASASEQTEIIGAPRSTAPPTIAGPVGVGFTLKASPGTWSGVQPFSYTYQWFRCIPERYCEEISGATGATYLVTEADLGDTIAVQVAAENVAGTQSARSEETYAVVAGVPSHLVYASQFGSAGTGDGQFNFPAAVAVDRHGYLWVLDRRNNRVEEFTEAGEYLQQFGSEGAGDGQMERPTALVATPGGNLWVLDSLNDRVEEFGSNGSFIRSAESPLISESDGLALAPDGDLWVAAGERLVVFSGYGKELKTIDVNGPPTRQPTGIEGLALANGHVWVSEPLNERVLELTETGEYVGEIKTRQLERASGLAAGDGHLFVGDYNTGDVDVFNEEGQLIEQLGGFGSGPGELRLNSPMGIAVSPAGDVWVTDAGNNRVEEWAPEDGEYEAPVDDAPPTITGPAGVGQTLAVDAGTWSGSPRPGFAYRWERCDAAGDDCSSIESAKGSTYVPTAEDVGNTVRVAVTATNAYGSATSVSAASSVIGVPPESVSAPTVSGIAQDGATLTATSGGWEGTRPIAYTYQWQRCSEGGFEGAEPPFGLFDPSCENIEGATNANYTLQDADVETTVRVIVSAIDVNGETSAASQPTAAVIPRVPPENTAPPVISGTPEEGQTLEASTGSWQSVGHASYAAQWQRCNVGGEECSDIEGATELSYVPETADLHSTLRVTVTASNGAGSASATSAQTEAVAQAPPPENSEAPALEGVSRDGQTLHASAGTWGGAQPMSYAYQWELCNPDGEECAPVEGASEPEYELRDGDIANTVRVTVTATNPGGSAQETSAASPIVEPEAAGELQAPSITGTPDEHEVLHASAGVWSGSEASISYQWESCNPGGAECAPVEGATGPEYDLAEGDVGTTLRVRVGVTSRLAALTDVSPPTAEIGAPGALVNVSPPSISGTPESGESLSVSNGSWSGEGLSYTYQWQACDAFGASCEPISGATDASYTIPGTDAGRTLRVLVTASAGGREASKLAVATREIAATGAPIVEQPPSVDGTALSGYTLSTSNGSWFGEGPITYTYQWERCASDAGCAPIEAATESDYTSSEADGGSSVRVAVTATGPSGSTTAVSNPTASIEPQPLTQFSTPSISGAVQLGSTLSAEPGIWSGSGPVSYAYQWESCNPHGADCAPIQGASEPSYTVASGDEGTTLRVDVTLTNPHGGGGAASPATPVVPGGELSAEAAQEVAHQTDPGMLAPSTTTELEEQALAPKLADGEQEITSQGTLTSSTVSKEIAGSFAINTPVGELSLTPVEPLTTATTLPTLVNQASALFANTWPATDTLVRAEPLGATAMLDIRSPEAPQSFSWEVGIGPDQQLTQLPDGSVAVVTAPERGRLPGEDEKATGTPPAEVGQPKTAEEEAEAEHEELETQEVEEKGETETEVPPVALPAAPISSAPAAESQPGEPQPQNTPAQYEVADAAMSSAETQTGGRTLMVIPAPSVIDAAGNAVPASLKIHGNTMTLYVKSGASTSYPWIASFAVASATDKASAKKAPTPRYGLSDFNASTFGTEGEKEEWASALDPNLEGSGKLKVTTARIVIPYNVFSRPGPESKRLEDWVDAVEAAGVPQLYITLGPDECDLPIHAKTKERTGLAHEEWVAYEKCWAPSAREYHEGISALMADEPGVKLWGAWNEPDFRKHPMDGRPHMAAQYWQEAQYVAEHTKGCGCTVVAGEFAFAGEFQGNYVSKYKETFEGRNKRPRCLCSRKRPQVWGFHDYSDIVHRNKAFAERFDKHFLARKSKARIWISEAGVQLHDGSNPNPTELANGSPGENQKHQREAAKDFEELQNASESHRIDRVYYYSYGAPSQIEEEKLRKEHRPPAFDSGLLSNVGEARPAYCVLLFSTRECPAPTPAAESGTYAANCAPYKFPLEREIPLIGSLNANGSPVSYEVQYGPTTAYGEHTPVKPGGSQSVAIPVNEPIKKKFTNVGSHGTEHFSVVAHSGGTAYPSADATVYWVCDAE